MWGQTERIIAANQETTWSLTYTAANIPDDKASEISVVSIDAAGNESSAIKRTIFLDASKLAPTGISLNEDAVIPLSTDINKATIATITGVDLDTPVEKLAYTIERVVIGNQTFSGSDTSLPFEIAGNTIRIKDDFDSSIYASLFKGINQISITLSVSDKETTPFSKTFALSVLNGNNNAPIALDTLVELSAPIQQGSNLTTLNGRAIADIFGSIYQDNPANDSDSPSKLALGGIAIVSNAASPLEGSWQYKATSNSTTWINLPTVSEGNPFILPATGLLRFAPRSTYFGSSDKPSVGQLGVRLLDSSDPTLIASARQLSSPLAAGGSAAASAKIVSLGLTVTKAPEAPTSLLLSENTVLKSTDSNDSPIGQLLATDPDTSQKNLKYSKANNDGDNKFIKIEPTGELLLSSLITPEQLTEIRNRGYLTINAQVSDDTQLTKQATLRIAVENTTNQAPTIANSQPISLGEMLQGTTGDKIISKTINQLFGGKFSDPIGSNNNFSLFGGVAIVDNDASLRPLDGKWQYRSVAKTWTDLPSLSKEIPFILSPTSELRFKASSSFSGRPGALSVRVLDNSKSYPDGLLDSNSVLISGFSGAASAEVVKLQTLITQTTNPPEKIFFSTERNILIDGNGYVLEGTLLGKFTAIDPDTNPKDLLFKGLRSYGTTDPNKVVDQLEITNGNQLRVKRGKSINSEDLKALSFSVSVQDGIDRPLLSSLDLNTKTNNTTFKLNALSFSTKEDTTIRSDTSVLPALTALSQPILFSATGVGGDLSVTAGATLTADDLSGISSIDLGLKLPAGQEVQSIQSLAPLLEFTLALDTPGSVARFEFELPSDLPWADLQNIKYLKQFANGGLSVFDYFTDEFGISTGARLETKGEYQYEALTDSRQIKDGKPVYLAVYIQDNGRGDDDARLGYIHDPGAPALFGIRQAALDAKALNFNTDPSNIALTLDDTNSDGKSTVQFVSNREAKFDNIINYFKVNDAATGSVTVGGTTYLPGDAGYISHALDASNTLNASGTYPNLATANRTESAKTLDFAPGGIWMPYVYVVNTGATYLPYTAANADGFPHFGEAHGSDGYNYLYMEDLPAGGDRDYNDLIIRISKPS